jgi:hypothetical protein
MDALTKAFARNVSPEPTSGCWLWSGRYAEGGYGVIDMLRVPVLAHRFSWIIFRGPIPDSVLACHKCDNPACVNPDHMFLGSPKDNMQDCLTKGRFTPAVIKVCKYGHPFNDENTYVTKTGIRVGHRSCRACGRRRTSKYQKRKRASRSLP